ncbi:MAG: sigma 54-interacting transcriptional regulator [Sandaracinaceae bacterium]
MSDEPASLKTLARHERLRGVQVARAILKDAFGLELTLVGPTGPIAHRRGGVMTGSSELCRAVLFSRDGFARCDAFYRELGTSAESGAHRCHLGLSAQSAPIQVEGELLGHAVASGYLDPRGPDVPDVATLAARLSEIDPHLPDPTTSARGVLVVAGDRTKVVRTILEAAAREIAAREAEIRARLADHDELPGLFGLIGASGAMRELFGLLGRVMKSDATVLLTGESGTGKELVARALHEHGLRAKGPFVAANCGAIGADVLESALFGHVRGAFSGAVRSNDGLFGAAHKGTLFLDEVGEMPPAMQVKLLRVLQDGAYLPVGATEPKRADVRVIAASHADLGAMVHAGSFRQDLFYRLHVLTIGLPPLRDRPGDLRLLLRYFMREVPGVPSRIGEAALRCIERYRWPGNVRELRAEVERWAVSAAGELEIGPEHLSSAVREAGGYTGSTGGETAILAASGEATLASAVEALERAIIQRGLERTEGNRTRLAKELGVSRTTLNERLKRYGLG